jgi:HSP20 family protein
MNDLFSQFFADWEQSGTSLGAYVPAMDLLEQDDQLIVKAELPGMTAEDIDISVQGNVLTLRGEKKEERNEEGKRFHYVERRSGMFHRTLSLPTEVDAENINASYRDGVLTIKLPKSEAAKPRRIAVKTE